MTESHIHKLVKEGVASALLQDGYCVNMEFNNKEEGEGRIDVYAEKPNGNRVKVEVMNTNIPSWLLVKLGHKLTKIGTFTCKLDIVMMKLLKMLALEMNTTTTALLEEAVIRLLKENKKL